MAHKEYTNTKPAVASTSKQGSQIRAEANKLIRDNEFEFHEHDIFEVENILLSKMLIRKNFGVEFEEKYYGGIYGEYVHNSRQKTLPTGNSPVLPLDPNIKRYPVPGEYVVCINHMGRTYYKTIINHNNNPNNRLPFGEIVHPDSSPVDDIKVFINGHRYNLTN